MQLTEKQVRDFQKIIYDHYKKFGRDFPWRNTTDQYPIFISEVMLQQTQTSRVAKKYDTFLHVFPSFHALARAELFDVLRAWQGLGYNRRAKFLHQSAKEIISTYDGEIPKDVNLLRKLPGIGTATAGSIAAFAFNKPTVFVETNIRAVLIHLFLQNKDNIPDKKLLYLAQQTLDKKNPRIWYYAITDYGVHLKSQGINPINKSKSYTKQSKFEGSTRQIRGKIIKLLLSDTTLTKEQVLKRIKLVRTEIKASQIEKIINKLVEEKILSQSFSFD
ncbi:A/G-specific adenine glycosylase [Candidatus Dependentiae bacterium]|nr:A/G-specific adenine glycosylase [Candidatus Dependentiae bacterium]